LDRSITRAATSEEKMNTYERLLDSCKKLFSLAIARELFDDEKRRKILEEAKAAMNAAQAEKN
jgi:succinate dehydrogenase flavin-adding protein (antitoxin of CptAB toxin-antitoxin module)